MVKYEYEPRMLDTGRNTSMRQDARRKIFDRAGWKCFYCQREIWLPGKKRRHKPIADKATLDHVIPSSKGGNGTQDNIVASCFDCNQKKADKLLTPA